MKSARLSDAELLPLVREGGETSHSALRELERRHFQAVRAFATACAVSPSAADALAGQAWQRALGLQDPGASGAVRPQALAAVLRTAADWAHTAQRDALNPELVAWTETQHSEALHGPGHWYSGLAGVHRGSLAARAFGSLPNRSQTVLWHHEVEHDDGARIDQLLGAWADEVSLLNRRALRELYHSYVRIHQDEIVDDRCVRFHRMVLAYADRESIDDAAELSPHIAGCAYCSRAVTDLERMRVDCGALLADAVLPWGGSEYIARSAAGLASGPDAPRPTRRTVFGDLAANARTKARTKNRSKARKTARMSAVSGANARSLARRDARQRQRANRVVQGVALVGVSSLTVAIVYAGTLRPGSPQSNESAPTEKVPTAAPAPPSPSPSTSTATATATATSTVTATETAPAPPAPTKSAPPPVAGAAIEWLFNTVDGVLTGDSSGNGIVGTLLGDPLPGILDGALDFNGQQFVASEDSVVDTNNSFSVSARVKLRENDYSQTVLSQDGAQIGGFSLQYDSDEDRWSMAMHDEDSQDSDKDEAVSESEPETGRWTHLTGVYDDSDNELRLYVDGVLEDTAEHSDDFGTEGSFVVGRVLLEDGNAQGFEGAIDNVRAFRDALSDSEAEALAD